MPFTSAAQVRWGNSPSGRKALGGQAAVDEWNHATNFNDLPQQARDKRRSKMKRAMQNKKSDDE